VEILAADAAGVMLTDGRTAEYLTVTADEGFQLLRTYARNHNRKLTEVASAIIDRQLTGAELMRRDR
jgi:AmiR/NasT family two-component response regulator